MADTGIKVYPAEVAKIIPAGKDEGCLGRGEDHGMPGPAHMCFSPDGKLYINDTTNKRITVYNEFLEPEKSIPAQVHGQMRVVDNTIQLFDRYGFSVTGLNGEKKIDIRFGERSFPDGVDEQSFIFDGKVLVFYKGNGSSLTLCSLNDFYTSPEKNFMNYSGPYFTDNEGHPDIRNYEAFLRNIYKEGVEKTLEYAYRNHYTYMGKDKDGLFYWAGDMGIAIYNAEGILIESFTNFQFNSYNVALHPSGDIYVLHPAEWDYAYDNSQPFTDPHYLYRIPRRWGYEVKKGIVTDISVRLRDAPHLKGNIHRLLYKDEVVEVLTKSAEPMKIDNYNDYWYKVKTIDDIVGWAYGAFIKVQ